MSAEQRARRYLAYEMAVIPEYVNDPHRPWRLARERYRRALEEAEKNPESRSVSVDGVEWRTEPPEMHRVQMGTATESLARVRGPRHSPIVSFNSRHYPASVRDALRDRPVAIHEAVHAGDMLDPDYDWDNGRYASPGTAFSEDTDDDRRKYYGSDIELRARMGEVSDDARSIAAGASSAAEAERLVERLHHRSSIGVAGFRLSRHVPGAYEYAVSHGLSKGYKPRRKYEQTSRGLVTAPFEPSHDYLADSPEAHSPEARAKQYLSEKD